MQFTLNAFHTVPHYFFYQTTDQNIIYLLYYQKHFY